MAKKKKIKRKKVVKRKTTKKKRRRKRKPVPLPEIVFPPLYNLHKKKLEIMREIPIMPCSAIAKDIHGLRFAHTQAEKVYNTYRIACESRGLVTRRVAGELVDGKTVEWQPVDKERWKIVEVPCVRFKGGEWEICDSDTGEKETFRGDGDGNNLIWAGNSAQTVAKKQALLDYFEVSWPQPTNWMKVVRDSILELSPEERVKAIEMIIPADLLIGLGIKDQLTAYFDKVAAKSKGAKNGNSNRKKRIR